MRPRLPRGSAILVFYAMRSGFLAFAVGRVMESVREAKWLKAVKTALAPITEQARPTQKSAPVEETQEQAPQQRKRMFRMRA